MLEFEQVPDPRAVLLQCLRMEFVRFSQTFNVLLAEHNLSSLRALRRLAGSKYVPEFNYKKKGTIPRF